MDDGEVAGAVAQEDHGRKHPPLVEGPTRGDEIDVGHAAAGQVHRARPRHTLVALALAHPQPGALEAQQQGARVGRLRARGDGSGIPLLGNVVMVALEPTSGDAQLPGEGVQLLEAGVTDQVGPPTAVRMPRGWVDEQGHSATVGRGSAGEGQ